MVEDLKVYSVWFSTHPYLNFYNLIVLNFDLQKASGAYVSMATHVSSTDEPSLKIKEECKVEKLKALTS